MDERYIDNNDGTITDTKTNLMWQQEAYYTKDWEHAVQYCHDLDLARYTDWRPPTIEELFSLVDFAKYDSNNRNKILTEFPNISPFCYWSSTPDNWDANRICCLNIPDSDLYYMLKSSNNYIKAVRNI